MLNVSFRRWSWDPLSTVTVTLEPVEFHRDDFRVIYDGKEIGIVGHYMGSLDRKIGRLRWPGKRRKLWHVARPGGRAMYEYVSRAEAIRWLLDMTAVSGD